jgi:hypothetical protein
MRQTNCQPSLRFFRGATFCSQREVVTGNLVVKEAMVRLECLAEPAEMPLNMPKLLSVLNPSTKATMSIFADPSRLAVPEVTVGSEWKVFSIKSTRILRQQLVPAEDRTEHPVAKVVTLQYMLTKIVRIYCWQRPGMCKEAVEVQKAAMASQAPVGLAGPVANLSYGMHLYN